MLIIHQFKLEDAEKIKNLWYRVVSSTDHPFAIIDTFRQYLPETRESLLVCTPYVSKDFFDMVRTLPNKATVKLLTRVPNAKERYMFDRTCRAIESFIQIANSLGLELSIMCKPNLHAKFIVVDERIVLSGSVNPTSSGMRDNDEILYVFGNSRDVKRHVEIFCQLWNCPRNTAWKNVQIYHGYNGYNDLKLVYKKIADAVIGFFHTNINESVRKSTLCEQIARRGFSKDYVIETVKKLKKDGILFEPKRDMLKLVDYQTNMHDFQ